MKVKKLKSDRSLRSKQRSPGRPPVLHRAERRPFWKAIAQGHSSEDAAGLAGVAQAVGTRWFRQCGGMLCFRFAVDGIPGSLCAAADIDRAISRVVEPSERDAVR